MPDRPNICLITTDTQRTDSLGCYGHPAAHSPNLDRLAADGVRFDECHANCPVCMPDRASLLTGLHPPVHGAVENGVEPRDGLDNFFDVLAGAGYTTMMVGKTHFGPRPAGLRHHRLLRGEKNQDVDDFYAEHIRAKGFARASAHPNPVPPEDFVDARCVDEAIGLIEDHGTGAPWCLHLSLLSPHGPLDPPGRWSELFDHGPLPDDGEGRPRLADESSVVRDLLGFDGDAGDRDSAALDRGRRLYYGLCAYVDDQIGRLIAYLDDVGWRDDTLILFTSDHGVTRFAEGASDKHNWRDPSFRVPLIASWPGTLPAGAVRGFAQWTDLTASICAVAGEPRPWIHGFDLIGPAIRGQDEERCGAVGSLLDGHALATRRWKFEWWPSTGEQRLFDRRADPFECRDLAGEGDHEAIRLACFEALANWRAGLADHADRDARLSGGGPVAGRVVAALRATAAAEHEHRLSEACAAIDARFDRR